MTAFCRGLAALALAVLAACAAGGDPDPAADGGTDGVPPPLAEGCRLFDGAVRGAARSYPAGNGVTRWIVGEARVSRGAEVDVVSAATAVVLDEGAPDCFSSAVIAERSVLAVPRATPMAAVRAAEAGWMYFESWREAPGEPFGVRLEGYGVARYDESTGQLVGSGRLLWTADRPSFGRSVVAPGDGYLYLHGCREAGFLRHDCYVARVEEARLEDESAYAYYSGGGNWTARVDGAWPVATAGPSVDVRFDAVRGRYLMAYVPVLGSTIHLRTGLTPSGPWSRAYPLARCDVPDEVFCGDVVLHPHLAPDAEHLALTYSAGSFAPGIADGVLATRFAVVLIPEKLP